MSGSLMLGVFAPKTHGAVFFVVLDNQGAFSKQVQKPVQKRCSFGAIFVNREWTGINVN